VKISEYSSKQAPLHTSRDGEKMNRQAIKQAQQCSSLISPKGKILPDPSSEFGFNTEHKAAERFFHYCQETYFSLIVRKLLF